MKTILVLGSESHISWAKDGLWQYLRKTAKIRPLQNSNDHFVFENAKVIFSNVTKLNKEKFIKKYSNQEDVLVLAVRLDETVELLDSGFDNVKYFERLISDEEMIAIIFDQEKKTYYKPNFLGMKVDEVQIFDFMATASYFTKREDAEKYLDIFVEQKKKYKGPGEVVDMSIESKTLLIRERI